MHKYTVQLHWPDKHIIDVTVVAKNIHQAATDAVQLYSMLAQAQATAGLVTRVREDPLATGMYELLGPL